MSRTLRGVWSRRWTLLPLLLLTTVVVAGTVTVIVLATAAHTSRTLATPLLLLGLVAVPATARELAAARRNEVALARLRGLEGGELSTLLSAEPLVVLALGALAGLGLGMLGGMAAAAAWTDGTASLGLPALLAALAVVVVALLALVAGMAGSLREPLAQQVSLASRPRAASVAAIFGSVLVIVAAVVAAYRSSVDSGDPDVVVLAGPALVGLAAGQVVVWVLRLLARAGVAATSQRGLSGFLAARRLARMADAVTPVRVLVAASVVAALAVTGAGDVSRWSHATARLRAAAPLQLVMDTDVPTALSLTRRLDPDGHYLMAAALVPGTGQVPNRRAFLDTSRFASVLGDFYAGTPAAAIQRDYQGLGGQEGLAFGTTLAVTVRGVSPRLAGTLRPVVTVAYTDQDGTKQRASVRVDIATSGEPASRSGPLPGCADGCAITGLTVATTSGDVRLPSLLTRLEVGDLDALSLTWEPSEDDGGPGRPGGLLPVDGGLLARVAGRPLGAAPQAPARAIPVLATPTAKWLDGPKVLESPGGVNHAATVLARLPALPLVEADGVLADLPRSSVGDQPTVPAAVVMVLARADTPPALLAQLASQEKGRPTTLAQVQDRTESQVRAAQARVYTVMALCCLLVALLVVATAAARQRAAWLRDVAALRVVGIDRRVLARAGWWELVALGVATVAGTATGAVVAVRLLLAHLDLVTVPEHALALRTGLSTGPIVVAAVAAALIVAVVAGRGRTVSPARSRPAILREEATP